MSSEQFTIDEDLIGRIENEISSLADTCKEVPGLVLTEDDLKCRLFQRLLRLLSVNQLYQSEDDGWASPLHAEVPWFDEDYRLTLRPDITVTDPSRLQINKPPKGHPGSKYFAFSADSIVIELKYYRDRRGILPNRVAVIRKDVDKIQRLIDIAHKRGSPKIYGVVAVLSRYPDRCDALTKLEDEVHHAHQAITLIILPPIFTDSIVAADSNR